MLINEAHQLPPVFMKAKSRKRVLSYLSLDLILLLELLEMLYFKLFNVIRDAETAIPFHKASMTLIHINFIFLNAKLKRVNSFRCFKLDLWVS